MLGSAKKPSGGYRSTSTSRSSSLDRNSSVRGRLRRRSSSDSISNVRSRNSSLTKKPASRSTSLDPPRAKKTRSISASPVSRKRLPSYAELTDSAKRRIGHAANTKALSPDRKKSNRGAEYRSKLKLKEVSNVARSKQPVNMRTKQMQRTKTLGKENLVRDNYFTDDDSESGMGSKFNEQELVSKLTSLQNFLKRRANE